jgi:tRNA A-37 threonylcarbamoyl transferase component Bud32
LALLRPLLEVIRASHARGLAHGSMVAGNVIVQARSASAHLLDFGLAAVVASMTDQAALISADLDGLTALERTVREFRRLASSPERPL